MADPVHHLDPTAPFEYGTSWDWREPSHGEHYRTCSYCGSIHPEDLAAEQPGTGTCQTCGQAGWSACLDGQQPRWNLTAEERALLSDDDRASLDGLTAPHSYDPGGWWASWADRKYGYPHKFNIDITNRDPERLYVLGSANHVTKPNEPGYANWVPVADLDDAGRAALDRDYPPGQEKYRPTGSVLLGHRPVHNAKFYTAHLADPAISDAAKDAIAEVSGLRFRFLDDGRIGWEPTHATV